MNDLNQWLKQMETPGGQQEPGKMPQGVDFDLPEMDGGVQLGDEKPQGLREVKYNKPDTPQSLFNLANQPEQNEGQQKKQQEQKQQQQKPTPNQKPPQNQMPPADQQEDTPAWLKLAMQMAEQEAQERKRQHEERMQNQQQQDSEKVGELDERLTSLEGRVEDIEGNYVGTATFEDGLGALQKQLNELHQPKLIQIGEREAIKLEKRTHTAFQDILELAVAFQQCYLVGPAGTGKTTLAEDVASAMGLEFGFISCSAGMAEAHLLGRMIANGNYLPARFVTLYENGGLFLFDEVDAADANTMLVLNSALANGYLSVPNRSDNPIARRHPDFVCLVAANTLGTGSFEYHGRNYLDAAFLDRFALSRARVDYDLELEREMLGGDAEFGRLLHKMRHNLESTKTRRVLSTRAFIGAAKLLLAGKEPQYVIDKLVLGWTDEEKARALKDCVVPKQSPLKQIGIKQREADKTRREQEAAKAKRLAIGQIADREPTESPKRKRRHDNEAIDEVLAVVEEATYAEEVPA